MRRVFRLVLVIATAACCLPVLVLAEQPTFLIVVGPSTHPPGSHEVAAGGRVLEYALQQRKFSQVHLVSEWPDATLRKSATTVVFLGDTFPPNRWPNTEQNLQELSEMMDRGCGIVCLHYATGLLGQDVTESGEHPLLHWMGGYFANRSCPHHQSIARIYKDANIQQAAPDHPVSRGWDDFVLHDEPYINNYFGNDENRLAANVTPLATSLLPPESPRKETVAWCVEREDGGRGFGIVMPHFYKNWGDPDLRTFILNGIAWTAHAEIPAEGMQVELPDLKTFDPAAVEFVPRKR